MEAVKWGEEEVAYGVEEGYKHKIMEHCINI